jgi:hypothetical protein
MILTKEDYPLTVPAYFVEVATVWHGGQSSALYSLASTGYIHDAGYRSMLESELRRCGDNDDTKLFLAWVEELPEDEDHDE